jgi:hypothetical protein
MTSKYAKENLKAKKAVAHAHRAPQLFWLLVFIMPNMALRLI